jgi:hypothetical protein
MSARSSRRTALICTAFLALLGCSKTQDTAPETRVFGQPPVIQSVSATPNPAAIASCDFTDMFLINKELCDDFPMLLGRVTVEARYTEVIIEATVTDPDDPIPPAPGTDILLVSASYVIDSGSGTPTENTIVLFDDGSQILFPFGQKSTDLQECSLSSCSCTAKTYDITSNDMFAADHRYTRAFAFAPGGGGIPAGKENLYRDCIAFDRAQASQIAADFSDAQIEFRIEAVDRSGNLTEAPTRPPATVGSPALTCSGDPCACCVLLNDINPRDPVADGGCRGLPGLMFDDGTYCGQVFKNVGTPTMPKFEPQVPPSFLNLPCISDADCNNVSGSCRQTGVGRDCPNGFCLTDDCLRLLSGTMPLP